jgi:hypothetical protein
MKPITLNQIQTFVNSEPFVLYGVSSNKMKFGNSILKELTKRGCTLFAVHPTLEKVEENLCYKSFSDLPQKSESAIICIKPEKATLLLDELQEKGIKNIWFQKGSATKEIIAKAQKMFPNVVHGKCILMFTKPDGFHKFHTNMVKFFGQFPKQETQLSEV